MLPRERCLFSTTGRSQPRPDALCTRRGGRRRWTNSNGFWLGVHKRRIGGTAMTVESNAWRGERMKRTGTTVRYETRTAIDRPIDEVFARLTNLDGYRTWMHRTG